MKTDQREVSYKVPGSNPEREVTATFSCEVFETADDVLSWLQDEKKAKTVIEDFNYGHDLKLRAKARQALVNANQGPDAAIARMAKDMVKAYAAAGLTISEDAALEQIKTNMKAAGANV